VRRLHTEVARREIKAVALRSAGADDGTQVLTDLTTLRRIVEDLRHAETAADAAGRLLAWLEERVDDGG